MTAKSLLLPLSAALALATATPAAAQEMKHGCMSMMQHGGGGHGGEGHGASHAAPAQGVAEGTVRSGVRIFDLAVTDRGFEPATLSANVGEKVRLVVTRRSDATCARDIVIPQYGVSQPLPLDTPVIVELTPAAAGEVPFSCAMNMVGGVIRVR